MPVNLDEFVRAISDSGIISAPELEALQQDFAKQRATVDIKEFARELVRQKKLTGFQARAFYHGAAAQLVIGSYVILDRIGSGGMGQVYKAEHRRMRRVVALKLINAVRAQEAVRRFQREVEAAAKLDHPNIVTAFDADVVNGTHYLAMEYVDGFDLATVVKEFGRVPLRLAVDWMLQAARGLEYAHGRGVIHRDIKPANLLLDELGALKILDMGLARLDDSPGAIEETAFGPLTRMGEIIGTIDFMSPEQAEDTRQAGPSSDIYSLGCTFYYLATGQVLYPVDTVMRKLLAHRDQPIPSLTQLRGEVPRWVDDLFGKMVAKKPEKRFPRMTDLIQAWEARRRELPSVRPDAVHIVLAQVRRARQAQGPATLNDTDSRTAGHDSATQPLTLALPAKPLSTINPPDEQQTLELDAPPVSSSGKPVSAPQPPGQREPAKPLKPPGAPPVTQPPVTQPSATQPPGTQRPTSPRAESVPGSQLEQPKKRPPSKVKPPQASDPIVVTCGCQAIFAAPGNLMGKQVACPSCGETLAIPSPADAKSQGLPEARCVCGQRYIATHEARGRTVKCMKCRSPLTIPQLRQMEVACRCGQRFAAAESLAGKTVQCTTCGGLLTIPNFV